MSGEAADNKQLTPLDIEQVERKEFVNADEIAKGLSPFQPETVAFESGRIMLNRINELLKGTENFRLPKSYNSPAFNTNADFGSLSFSSYFLKALNKKAAINTELSIAANRW